MADRRLLTLRKTIMFYICIWNIFLLIGCAKTEMVSEDNTVTNENKEKFYKELMKYFMYPKYFGYMKENYRYSLSKKKLSRKRFLHNPMVNNISGRNRFNKIKQKLFYNRIYSDYGPYGEFLNIFRNAGISDEIARKICPWKESAMISYEDMSVVVNGIYY